MTRVVTGLPSLEKIEPNFGQSFLLRKFEEFHQNQQPFWHFHPELEIVYVKEGSGKRQVGNHISYYNGGDLILLGPNLPHYGFTDRLSDANYEIVLQMKEDFMGKGFLDLPEMSTIHQLFEKSKLGLSFHGNTRDLVGSRLEDLFHMTPYERLISFVNVLHILAESKEYEVLNAAGSVALIIQGQDTSRIDTIYTYVRTHFQDTILLEDVASIINMTVPSFCRYFKRVTGKTFIEFVNEFRIVHACKLLSEEKYAIADVCFESGFNNFSHFNKVFKARTGSNPKDYRATLEKVVYEEHYVG